jgi:hypothetical protein
LLDDRVVAGRVFDVRPDADNRYVETIR